MPRGSSRNIGNNYALAWRTGGGTHMTLVYMINVKRGYEQSRVKGLVEEFLDVKEIPQQIPLTVGEMLMERCISVTNDDISELQQSIYAFLLEKGFDMRPLRSAHIDLRGNHSNAALYKTVGTRDWLW